MDADCYCDYDYDPPEFFRKRISTARKEHRCGECGRIINVGAKYEYVAGKWDGHLNTFKTCEQCHDLRQWLVNSLPCFCWGYGGAFEEAAEYVDEACWAAPEETKGLRFGFWRRLYPIVRRKRVVN